MKKIHESNFKFQFIVKKKSYSFFSVFRYWVFFHWGRIATCIGGYQLFDSNSIEDAKSTFSKKYKNKTKNEFGSKQFVKYHGYYYQLMNADEEIQNAFRYAQSSTLDKRIESLLKLLIDEGIMEDVMVSFGLDTIKMPLAKINSKHINKARNELYKIRQKILEKNNRVSVGELI